MKDLKKTKTEKNRSKPGNYTDLPLNDLVFLGRDRAPTKPWWLLSNASKRCSRSEAIAFGAAQGSMACASGGGSDNYGEVLAFAGNGGSSF